jgi:gluconate 2-dehydrogenase gamma chain
MVSDPGGNRNFDGQRPEARSILGAGHGPGGKDMNEHDASRRRFLQSGGGALGAGWLALHWPQLASAAEHAHAAAAGDAPREFKLLTPAEARDVEAIAAQIVPSGATPGAREAGVVYFVDHIHAGPYAAQRRLVPAPTSPRFPAGLAPAAQPGAASFADLPGPQQVAYLKGIEADAFLRADEVPHRARPARAARLRR